MPIYVKLKSEFLWLYSDKAYYKCIELLEGIMDTEITTVKMSRVDLCCHTDIISMNELNPSDFSTRSNKHSVIYGGNDIETIMFGESPIMARIYDKLKEVNQTGKKKWFFDIWQSYGCDCSNVINIEFELKRKFLKEHGIETYTDLLLEFKSIWLYLTKEWLRYTLNNKSRLKDCDTSEKWEIIQHAFDDWLSVKGISRFKQKSADEIHLLNMISGYVLSHATAMGVPDMKVYIPELVNNLIAHYKRKGIIFYDEVERRKRLQ